MLCIAYALFQCAAPGNRGHWSLLFSLPQCDLRRQSSSPSSMSNSVWYFTSDVYYYKIGGFQEPALQRGHRKTPLSYCVILHLHRVSCIQRFQGSSLPLRKRGYPPQSSRKFTSRVIETWQPAFHALGIGICLCRSLHFLTSSCHVRVSVLCWQHSVASRDFMTVTGKVYPKRHHSPSAVRQMSASRIEKSAVLTCRNMTEARISVRVD